MRRAHVSSDGAHKAGVAFFRDWVEREPWRIDWRVNLARALVIAKEYSQAAEQLQCVLRMNRNDSRALVGLAELFERNGYYQRAARLLERLVAIFPRHGRARSFLGDCYIVSCPCDVVSRPLLTRARLQKVARAFATRGCTFLHSLAVASQMGNFDGADAVLQEQMRMFPTDSEAYSRMAELHAQKGATEEAIALYKKARAVDPTDSSSLFNIGLCYLDSQNFLEARAYFQQHLAENPGEGASPRLCAKSSPLSRRRSHVAARDCQHALRGR